MRYTIGARSCRAPNFSCPDKNITEYLNQSNDTNQFCHRYYKILGNRKNNIAELLYDSTTGTYVFENDLISEKLFNHPIKNKNQGKTYESTFKTNIECKLKAVSQTDFLLSNDNFFCKKHIQDVMNQTNKNSSPGVDRITPELDLNDGKNLVTALNILMQASYQLRYFPKPSKEKQTESI